MNRNLKKVMISAASLLMMASVGAGISQVNANADGTDSATTWYNTPRLTARHMREIRKIRFNRNVASGMGSYVVTLKNGELIYGTPTSPFGRQLRRYLGHSHRGARRHYRRHAVKRHRARRSVRRTRRKGRRHMVKRHRRRTVKRHAKRRPRRHVSRRKRRARVHNMYLYLPYDSDSYGDISNMNGQVHYAKVQIIKIKNLVRHPHNVGDLVFTYRTDDKNFKKVYQSINNGFPIHYQRSHGHVYVVDSANGGDFLR